jgi:glyoxylase-like metal-dependent hydrolase (beta-lactamase superfamily II)
MREIVPGVFTWSWFSEPHGYDFNGHFLELAEGNICVDPVNAPPEVVAELARRGVARIILTNRNHVRDADRVRSRTGARTAIHPADAAYARGQEAEIDDEIQVGDRIGPLAVIGVPGKSPGEVALHWPARHILVVGDAVIGNPPGKCGVLRDKVMDDPKQLRASVRRLLDVDFDTLLVGDGVSILGGAKDRLRELIETF